MPPVSPIPAGPNRIRILLTTDNHVGYLENDPVRGDDSWKTFQETMQLAKIHDVDMVVQGGDLFHVTRPSKKSLFHVIQTLRLNCLGDRPCELELLSDASLALRSGESLNYEDPNLNVAVPVFAISGNHDDATGAGLLSPLDVVAATGLVNYFGQIPQQDKIRLSPLLFQKGTTRLSLYGLNNMRDERLQRIMRNGDVTFQKPKDADSFFNLMCIHQNHARHSLTSYVPEDFLPLFLDFVLWGHEHECLLDPQYNPATGFDTLQPGSTVATALSEGETAPKHAFLLDVEGKEYSLTPLRLLSVRPFLMRDVSLRQQNFVEGPASKQDIADFLVSQVEEMIEEAKQQQIEIDGPADMLPLIRLRVDHTGDYETENSRRFSNKFVGRIANVNDILLYHKRKTQRDEPERKLNDAIVESSALKVLIQQLLKSVLGESNLYLVSEDTIFDATKKFIEQDDKEVLTDYVDHAIEQASNLLLNINIDEAEFHVGDDVSVKRGFRQLLNKLRLDAKRAPISDEAAWNGSDTSKATQKPNPTLRAKDAAREKPPPRTKPTAKGKTGPNENNGSRSSSRRKPVSAEIVSDEEMSDISPEILSDESEPEAPKRVAKKAARKPAPKKSLKRTREQSLLDDILSLGG